MVGGCSATGGTLGYLCYGEVLAFFCRVVISRFGVVAE